MSFIHYRITLKLLSPLHIGKRKYRNLMETRDYVPGRTLWGALTARITRDYFDGEPDLYEEIGNFLNKNFRFGYLWPSLDGEDPYFPWEHEDFDYLLKSGYMGQPIDYTRGATEESQLHEVEFIAPKTRDGRQVYLIGDLWVNDKNSFFESKDPLKVKIEDKTIDMAKVFNSIQIGGERNYGWGRVECERLKLHNGDAVGGIKVDRTSNDVALEFPENSYLTAHLIVGEGDGMSSISGNLVAGQIEPLTGYSYDDEKGWNPVTPPVCYVPGSKLVKTLKLFIEKYGILTKKIGRTQ